MRLCDFLPRRLHNQQIKSPPMAKKMNPPTIPPVIVVAEIFLCGLFSLLVGVLMGLDVLPVPTGAIEDFWEVVVVVVV